MSYVFVCTAQPDAALGEELDWRTLRLRWGVHKALSLQKNTRKLALEDATAVLLGTSSAVLKRTGKPDFEDSVQKFQSDASSIAAGAVGAVNSDYCSTVGCTHAPFKHGTSYKDRQRCICITAQTTLRHIAVAVAVALLKQERASNADNCDA
eukprot:1980-Heterococcus_DN1.PRE.3